MMFAQRLLPALFLGLVATSAHAGEWQEMDSDNGFISYSKEIEGSKLVAFKGVGDIDAPISKLLWVLTDNVHRAEWVDRLYETKELDRIGEHEFVVYQAYRLPVFISNRDYVYRGKATTQDDGSVIVTLASEEHPDAPETIGVRAHLNQSSYTLTPAADGKTTVTVEIHTDPKGLLPSWLVNLIQKSWPLKTLNGLATQVQKDFVTDYPLPPSEAAAADMMAKTATTATSTTN